ncbi:hypothetical protein CAEBREN_04284 [Caenorhabditis brenneri]|uniref:Uncharacterized protein n=1 Tax=Caenorhabditis brenneri TaxID=135651 RepID=G0NZD9_CAEBE|nr:hypothetical protein CAEBREN_04284 [Caenorhabditis brenneri]
MKLFLLLSVALFGAIEAQRKLSHNENQELQRVCGVKPTQQQGNGRINCPPQLAPVPGENGAQYKYCSPSAPLNDAIQGCGANRHCQFSTNLERYICCGLESDVRLLNVCPPQQANLVPVEYARAGTSQSCPDNSACLYTGNDNGFICCRVQLGQGKS